MQRCGQRHPYAWGHCVYVDDVSTLPAKRELGADRPKETTEVIISTIGVGLVVAERRSGTWQGRIGGVARGSPGGTFPPDRSRCDGDGALGWRQVRPDQFDWKFAVAVNNMLFRVSVWAPRGSFTCAGSTA